MSGYVCTIHIPSRSHDTLAMLYKCSNFLHILHLIKNRLNCFKLTHTSKSSSVHNNVHTYIFIHTLQQTIYNKTYYTSTDIQYKNKKFSHKILFLYKNEKKKNLQQKSFLACQYSSVLLVLFFGILLAREFCVLTFKPTNDDEDDDDDDDPCKRIPKYKNNN